MYGRKSLRTHLSKLFLIVRQEIFSGPRKHTETKKTGALTKNPEHTRIARMNCEDSLNDSLHPLSYLKGSRSRGVSGHQGFMEDLLRVEGIVWSSNRIVRTALKNSTGKSGMKGQNLWTAILSFSSHLHSRSNFFNSSHHNFQKSCTLSIWLESFQLFALVSFWCHPWLLQSVQQRKYHQFYFYKC